ncbi:phenylacetate-CoA oxygenase subunit PaaJ [Jatrophihabitans telluris]|uniref:Phenylacetate-CoA oxygenase subunit PaaJ n=1 Tax=Jatrophihabitans telluris TaxID=2038343 RepID=A0ABY4QTU3_9ACTN|nr:1,2-phenylacetyl-CoA epoxidase subunit PaaD [Jatrophihabitans telluris]UQX86920.1 phenylacetate-CoA oxygenase subunit PaaJ [Jatrophihabitans telluris]
MTTVTDRTETARALAAQVRDPEMPMLTLEDLGVLRGVTVSDACSSGGSEDVGPDGSSVVVTITPTYSGCPAMATMRDDIRHILHDHGFDDVRVAVQLEPAWTTDWITPRGRARLAEHGISAPAAAPKRSGPIPLTLVVPRRVLHCPRCDSSEVELTSEFGPTACTAIYRCRTCLEPFQHVKEI